jgi:hypothetical protein
VLNRRRFLTAAAAAGGLLAAGLRRPARSSPAASQGCHHWVFFLLAGGMDAVYTTDPKEKKDVESWVDVPFAPGEIRELGGIVAGPHLQPLGPIVDRLAIVNGIRVQTANHMTGMLQFDRMNLGSLAAVPTIGEILGARRDDRVPLPCATQEWVDGALDTMYSQSAEDFTRLAKALQRQAAAAAGAARASYHEASQLYARLAEIPPLRLEPWEGPPVDSHGTLFLPEAADITKRLQRTLWLLEHDITASVNFLVGEPDQSWDSHNHNGARQTYSSAITLPILARFLDELGRRRCAHGTLAACTTVVTGSEIGRFPAINTNHGKDHFPETPLLFFGAGMNAGRKGAVYGATGRKMEALPVSLANGRPKDGGHFIQLDDVGTTLLHLAGVADPRVYGYRGRVLDFLAAA